MLQFKALCVMHLEAYSAFPVYANRNAAGEFTLCLVHMRRLQVQLCVNLAVHQPARCLTEHGVCLQDYFASWPEEGTVDLFEKVAELIIMTASRTLMGEHATVPRCLYVLLCSFHRTVLWLQAVR